MMIAPFFGRPSRAFFWAIALFFIAKLAFAGALEDYARKPDPHYNWKLTEQKKESWGTVVHLELVSQHWRNQFWSHHLVIARPKEVRNPETGLLLIGGGGDGEKYVKRLKMLAQRAGAAAAVITHVPNQPLYNGLKEDALIAFTLAQFLKTGDETWPLLFPMVKSVVRGMDSLQAFLERAFQQKIEGFVVTGASKRGWTTWLTGAVDSRIKGLAPMVIDILNMEQQLRWAEKAYGRQSEKIDDYTELSLHQNQDDPAVAKLRRWIDPYEYRQRYTMPKLLLLGTNDPYWVVDSLRHYWNELPAPKLIFQTPNAGHDLNGGKQAMQTLAAFFQMIADGQKLPQLAWELPVSDAGEASVKVMSEQPVRAIQLWTATSEDRDFRNEHWSSRSLKILPGSRHATVKMVIPKQGYRAYLFEVEMVTSTGHPYNLSTEARVLPDDIK
ncbi:PhoPQ-activated pathogenicity-related family protein [Nitrosococcus watsonii]|uniref:PhoPQ-activated pathogenicity-related protein PqaA type n=1 Tax=Nitrosococcus watsoni (strain C-113) TaxID=105559 RepID=D8K5I3_NITWC|nr:PhoPQ-activated pathogenicity-like protein PqaA type [Nitrosococcus watsonii]ADJ28160.1 PhoPQ-activated pathogenicity-related protein PqaA type [Nitrosococcus watsonii C-113]